MAKSTKKGSGHSLKAFEAMDASKREIENIYND